MTFLKEKKLQKMPQLIAAIKQKAHVNKGRKESRGAGINHAPVC
jgi:hypothetical protein